MVKIKALLAKIAAKLVTIDSDISTAQGDISDINDLLGSATMTTTAQTVTGAVNELDADIGALIVAENKTIFNTSTSIASKTAYQTTVTIPAKTGYTLIGASLHLMNGSNNTYVQCSLTLNNGILRLFNGHTSSVTVTRVDYKFIYQKS